MTRAERAKLNTMTPLDCPECGSKMYLRRSKTKGLFYLCERAADGCTTSHKAHDDGRPTGEPASKETRALRGFAHHHFDKLWNGWKAFGGLSGRDWAYLWLSEEMDLDPSECHFGKFDAELCERARECCERMDQMRLIEWAIARRRAA